MANFCMPDSRKPKPVRNCELDGGYGWVCVICQLLITANTWGVNGGFGVYLSHYFVEDTFPGTSEITYAFIGGLGISQVTFIAPFVTFIGRKFGMHSTMAIGIVLETAALVASSFATRVWHLFLAQGVLYGWGCSFLYVGSIGIIPQWFTRRRSLASAIAAAGSGLGGMSYALGFEAMIECFGFAWCFRISAAVAFTINTICTVLISDRNEEVKPNQKAFDLALLKQYRFLLIVAWGWLSTLGYTIILFSLPDNALKIGLKLRQGSIVAAIANLGMAIGRPVIGYFSDRIGRINMVCIATLLCAMFSFAIWIPAQSYSVLLVFAFCGGTTCGTFYAVSVGCSWNWNWTESEWVIAPLLAECLGLKEVPAALSVVWTSIVVPTTFAAPLALALRSNAGSRYMPVQILVGAVFAVAGFVILLLRVEMHPETKKEKVLERFREQNGSAPNGTHTRLRTARRALDVIKI